MMVFKKKSFLLKKTRFFCFASLPTACRPTSHILPTACSLHHIYHLQPVDYFIYSTYSVLAYIYTTYSMLANIIYTAYSMYAYSIGAYNM